MNDDPDTTVYAIWIGTNDLGNGAFITDSQVAGTTIESYLDCVYDQLARVYANGGRYFVIMNIAPLNLNPQYGLPGKGGLAATQYWPDKNETAGGNVTEISYIMLEQLTLVNAVYQYRTPFAVEINRRYPGSHFAVYDVHGLMTDIYNHPASYLNGTAPLNVTGVSTLYVHWKTCMGLTSIVHTPLQPHRRRLHDYHEQPRLLHVVRRAAPIRADRACRSQELCECGQGYQQMGYILVFLEHWQLGTGLWH